MSMSEFTIIMCVVFVRVAGYLLVVVAHTPPQLISIALRGEWSLSKVFDIYFKFGAIGNHYFGQILVQLNPHESSFGDLPPHFSCGRENKCVDRAMHGMFGSLTKVHTSTNAILLLCLASIVHHSDQIDKVILKNPGHIFGSMYIFSDKKLLCELKKLDTQEPSEGIQNATGVPPPCCANATTGKDEQNIG